MPTVLDMNFGEAAPLLDAMGYDVVPIKPGTKAPRPNEWTKGGFAVHSDKFCDDYTGILTRYTPAVDIDVSDSELVRQIEAIVLDVTDCHELPPPARIGMAPRRLLMFRTEEPFDKLSTGEFDLASDPVVDGKKKASKVEILATGQQFVAIAIHPNTNKPYAWNGGGDPLTISHASLPVLNWSEAVEIIKQADALLSRHGKRINRSRITQHAGERKSNEQLRADDPLVLRNALESIPNQDEHFDDWIAMLYATKAALGDPGMADFLRWSGKSDKHDEDTAISEWRKAKPTRRGAGSIYWMAERSGWKMPETVFTFGSGGTKTKSDPELIPLLDLAALQAASQSITWSVKHVIPSDSIGVMFGGSGTFKSFVALDYALHVAHGLPWLGRKTKKGAVIFIAAEGGSGLWRRIQAWHVARNMKSHGIEFYVVPVAVSLAKHSELVVDAAKAIGVVPSSVIVDTMSQTFDGEENSATEVSAYLRELGLAFRALWRCVVLVIHHSGHAATERPRGSSAIRSNVDFMLGVFRDEKEMIATVECHKQKDGELFEAVSFGMASQLLGHDEDQDPITSLAARHLDSVEAVADEMRKSAISGRGGRNSLFLSLLQGGMTEKELRHSFYEDVGLEDPHAKKIAYYRARDWAIKAGYLDIAQGYVLVLKDIK